jgi:hypothetical protein
MRVRTLAPPTDARLGFQPTMIGFDRLFAYWTVLFNAAGASSPIALANAAAWSVTTSSGWPWSRIVFVKNRRAATVSRRFDTYKSMTRPW